MFGKCIKDKWNYEIVKWKRRHEGLKVECKEFFTKSFWSSSPRWLAMKGWNWLSAKIFLQNVFGQVFCFLSPRWLAQLVCTGRGYNPLLSLAGNSKREIQFTWQRCALASERNTMLRCAQMSVSWFDFSLHSSLSMALPDVYMIFGVIWGVANGAVLPGRVFRIFGRLVFHVLTAPVFQTGWKQAEGHFLSISIFQSFSNSIKFVIQFSSS